MQKKYNHGFTIVELIVVIVVIGILTTLAFVSFGNTGSKARDTSVLSDIDTMEALQTSYATKNNVAGKAYYSGSGNDADLDFTPSSGNVIDVVINSTDYCIRGYNIGGTKNSIYEPFVKESSPGVCDQIPASAQAIANSPPAPSKWTKVGVGASHTCAISLDYKVYCWGENGSGQLGNGSTATSLTPVAVNTSNLPGNKTVKELFVHDNHNCVIASDNKIYCWGDNFHGQIGNGSLSDSVTSPSAVDTTGVLSGLTIKSIVGPSSDSGAIYTCVIASNDKMYCWGLNNNGQFGDGTNIANRIPVAVNTTTGALAGKTIKSVATGNDYVCVIASDSKGYCWGSNQNGQLGDGTNNTSYSPVAIDTTILGSKTLKYITAKKDHTCVIASDDQAYCWGRDGIGASGYVTEVNSPVQVDTSGVLSGLTIKTVAAGEWFTCAIASNDKAYCWGDNNSGQLGDGSVGYGYSPVEVRSDGELNNLTLKSIYTSNYYSCAIASNNKAYCWGNNNSGQLGNNSSIDSNTPVGVKSDGALSGLTIKSLVVEGRYYSESVTMAIASDNNIYCWGGNGYGRFGDNSTADSLAPKKCGIR